MHSTVVIHVANGIAGETICIILHFVYSGLWLWKGMKTTTKNANILLFSLLFHPLLLLHFIYLKERKHLVNYDRSLYVNWLLYNFACGYSLFFSFKYSVYVCSLLLQFTSTWFVFYFFLLLLRLLEISRQFVEFMQLHWIQLAYL